MKNSTLKKMAAYSAAALASASLANAQIVYHDVNPDVTFNPNDSLALDLDNNGTMDYYMMFLRFNGYQNDQLFIAPLNIGNMAIGEAGWAAWNWYGIALNAGDSINASANWVCPGGVDPRSRVFFASTYNGTEYGNFADGQDHYLGIKFQIGANIHYGWIRVNVNDDVSGMTLKDWAYRQTPNTGLKAGQTTVTQTDDQVLQNSKIYGSMGKIYVHLSQMIEGTITVYNNLGEKVMEETISQLSTILDASSLEKGIYNVIINTGNSQIMKKVIL
ncbi:MAG: T9SS type A sorting domain-containing protein [Bacteroidales bacterium]|nr:T9SS type A sorting domain-containing protein [Bacteroidales bacterium]